MKIPIEVIMILYASKKIKELEAQIKVKDEEINKLEERVKNLHDDVCCMMDRNIRFKNQAKKSRSIVAMLFWEWKKHKQTLKEKRDEENNETPSRDSLAWFWIVAQSEILFKKAYAMLKATT